MNFSSSAFARRAAIVIFAALGAASGAALPQTVLAQGMPLTGTFNFVPERSTFMGPARYKSATMTLTADQLTIEGVDGNGKPVKLALPAATDGKPHPIAGVPEFDTVTWSRFSDTIATYAYLRRKSNVILGSRSLSYDGNILTFNEKIFDDKGKQTGTATMIFAKPGFETASATPPRAPVPPPVLPTTTPDEDAGGAALAKDDADGAIAAFTRAIDKKDPIASPAYDHVMRGLAYTKKMMYDQALADFDMAIMLKPDDTDAHFRRGAARAVVKNYQGTIDDLSVVIDAGTTNAVAYSVRGFAYDALGQYNNGNADQDKACMLNMEFCKKQ